MRNLLPHKLCKAFGTDMRELAVSLKERRVAKTTVVTKAVMGESSGAIGGYTVPEEVQVNIDEGLAEVGIFHRLCYRQPMLSRECIVAGFDLSAAHATGFSPLFGGMGLTWTSEGQSITESEPSFAAADLVCKDLEATVYASNQLVNDGGIALGRYLEWKFLQAIEWAVERECFNGVLPGRPQGIVSSPATVAVTRAGAGHIAVADVAKMVAALLPACFARAVFACHPTALADVIALASYQANMDVATSMGLCGSLMARPLYVTEKLPVLGTRGDLMLFDPMCYVLGSRSVEVACTGQESTAFARNQTVYRLVWRGDGQSLARGTSTLQDGSTTSSPFVAIAT